MMSFVLWALDFALKVFLKLRLKYPAWLIHRLKVALLKRILHSRCPETIKRFAALSSASRSGDFPPTIYTLWFQGYDAAPEIVKKCISSLKSLDGYDVKVLDQSAVDALPIDDVVVRHYKAGHITRTHFSDIVRFFLLSRYGGLWADSTILARSLPADLRSHSFFSLRCNVRYKSEIFNPAITGSYSAPVDSWTAFLVGSERDGVVAAFAYDMFVEYWHNSDKLVDYFLVDAVLRLGYDEIPAVRMAIDDVCLNNNGCTHELYRNINSRFDENLWNALNSGSSCNVFKLSYKDPISPEPDTFYDRVVRPIPID